MKSGCESYVMRKTDGKRPLVDKFAALIMLGPRRDVFDVPGNGGKFVESEMSIVPPRADNRKRLTIEETPLLQSGNKVYLLVQDASDRYHLSPYTLRRLCRDKRISCRKRGGRWLIEERSLKRYCADTKKQRSNSQSKHS